MRAYVFTDKALAKHAGQFVWLSIDTEKAQNAAFSKKYPIRAWPSMYVIDPDKEKIALRWVGGATVAQLEKLFADGLKAVQPAGGDGPALARADRLYGDGLYQDAIAPYGEALKAMSPKDPQYNRALEALLFCYQAGHRDADCAALARERIASVKGTTSFASLAGSGLDCALGLPESDAGRAGQVAAFTKDVRASLDDPALRLAADDRSALYSSLFDEREDAKDEAGARKIADAWVDELSADAARAATPEQRTALDPDRLGAFTAAKRLEEAIPMLEQSAKDFPQDYNPPARLAHVYFLLKRYDEAMASSDRALSLVYGPRRIRVLSERAEIQQARGDRAAARKTLEEAIRFADGLPEGQRNEEQVVSLRRKLDAI
jgi:tetratricopeptide (TPR) repeat protein